MSRKPSLTARALTEELEELFPNAHIFLLDRTYSIVDQDFSDEWQDYFKEAIWDAADAVWDPMFDCEDFVELAKVEAKKLHMLNRKGGLIGGQGIAIGMLCFHENGEVKRGHAVCLIREPDGWVFWDAIDRQRRELTEAEYESAFLIQL